MSKVHLILVDGMRPDSLEACGNPFIPEFLEDSLYTLNARTVFPSMTLPCHMSLFHSVDPERHGVTTNVYSPQVRPVNGICEQLKNLRTCAMVYNWEELRDLSRPGSLAYSAFFSMTAPGIDLIGSDRLVTETSVKLLRETPPDFLFTYLGAADEVGHDRGWMSPEYLHAVDEAWKDIERLVENTPEDTLTIILADHGGHERTHGTGMEADMTIPVILHGTGLCGKIAGDVSIRDIAPTVVKMLGASPAREWEGRSLL